ncbi:tetraspanin-33-like [Tubulanus polymorphus]|uniref:tetraspanin-33-like n=1 Tax=Tubulanus polymorphus TaxID=672921 RepID=UPI003DA48E65
MAALIRIRGRSRRKTVVNPFYKYTLFFINFLLWVLGGVAAGLGAWLLYVKEKKVKDVMDFIFDPAILMCVTGAFVFILSTFGCTGSLRENTCFLKCYHIIITILLLLEVLFGVLVFLFFYVESIRKKMTWLDPEEFLQKAIIRYRDDDDLRDSINNMQQQFKCCGSSNDDNGYLTWSQNEYFNCSEASKSWEKCSVPYSCCKPTPGELRNLQCGLGLLKPEKAPTAYLTIYVQGCVKGFGKWLEDNAILVGGICLGVIIPQIILIWMSRTLSHQIQTQRNRIVQTE